MRSLCVSWFEVLALTRKQFERCGLPPPRPHLPLLFSRLFGPMTDLQQQQYLTDPRRTAGPPQLELPVSVVRKLIADFYMTGDARGPRGSLKLHQLTPGASLCSTRCYSIQLPAPGQMPRLTARAPGLPPSSQRSARTPMCPALLRFAVYRPTSKDAIAKMLSGVAVRTLTLQTWAPAPRKGSVPR